MCQSDFLLQYVSFKVCDSMLHCNQQVTNGRSEIFKEAVSNFVQPQSNVGSDFDDK